MVKDDDTVIREFNELVDVNSPGLKEWLGEDESAGAGWSKGDGSGKAVGHESGRKIIKILKKNPSRDNKRHLVQEQAGKQNADSKSAESLKNWVTMHRRVDAGK